MKSDVVIVGGSLSGLAFALACASRGVRSCVIERGHRHQGGGTLGVDGPLLWRVIGLDPAARGNIGHFPVVTEHRKAVSWQILHRWLRNLASLCPEITLLDGLSVSEVVQSGVSATAITADGSRIEAPIIVGADGYRSVVRQAVNPERPYAPYAGYLLWRGLVSEQNLPSNTRLPQNNQGVALVTLNGYRLVAYPVAGTDGSLEPGHRLVSFAWYDLGRAELLREHNCLSDSGEVFASLDANEISPVVLAELRKLAVSLWPNPWLAAIKHVIDQREIFATPIAEYRPERLVCGRLALIGDAAHVASPVIGRGFTTGILDAELLAKCVARSNIQDVAQIVQALKFFERNRLPEAQSLVDTSMAWSRAFVAGEAVSLWKGWKRSLQNKS